MKITKFVFFISVFEVYYFVDGKSTITLLHTNDIHSRVEETDQFGSNCQSSDRIRGKCFGGFGRLSTAIKNVRKDNKNVLLLDGGDQQTGTLWYDVFKGNATLHFMNKLGYDAMVLGNHDFDGGVDHVVRYLKKANATVIMSNVDVSGEPSWPKSTTLFHQSQVLVVSGQKIGLCGYVLRGTPRVSKSGPNIKFGDEVTSIRTCVGELGRLGVKRIIALGHSGIEMDRRIAKEVDNVDVVIGGHTNTFLFSGSPPSNDIPTGPYPIVVTKENGKKCLVVQAFAYTKYLGHLNVTFDSVGDIISWTGNPILLDQKVTPDKETLSDIAAMKRQVDSIGKVKIGQSLTFLDGSRRSCRLGECALGNLITDAAVFEIASKTQSESSWTTAAIALWTANSIMASIEVNRTGYVTYEDIVNAFPYNNKIDIVELKGTVLQEILERSFSFYNEKSPSGFFLQVSGLRLSIDGRRNIGNRVLGVYVRCADCKVPVYNKLNKSKVYKVIISSYMASGAAGYEMMRTKRTGHTPGATKDIEAIIRYIRLRTPLFVETGTRLIMKHPTPIKSSGCQTTMTSHSIYIVLVLSIYCFQDVVWLWLA